METRGAGARTAMGQRPASADTVVTEGQAPGFFAGLGQTFTRGVVAGLFAGLLFLLSQMGWAVENLDKPAIAPLLDMSTVFSRDELPAATPENAIIGLVTHLSLSMFFGIGFTMLVPLLRNTALLLLGGLVFGLVLYVVNIQLLGRTVFEWFTNPNGPPQIAEIFFHAEFGLLLVPFFIGAAQRVRAPAA
ncbi:MAG: hypothetical protein M3481_11630 [Actinomycetota bacterium]|nr:hypothetical protein [Actinomycetota bacterium]